MILIRLRRKQKDKARSDDFDFDIVNFPFFDGEVPRVPSYDVYFSKLIRFARMSSHLASFDAPDKTLTAKLLQHGYQYYKLRKALSSSTLRIGL